MAWLAHPALKLLLLVAAALLNAARSSVAQGKPVAGEPWLRAVSVLLVGLACLTFFDRPPWSARFLNPHDLFHQYFGPKYSPELDRFSLYPCTLTALDEVAPQRHARVTKIRDLTDYKLVAKQTLLGQPATCQQLFTADRWRLFQNDLARFDDLFHPAWRNILTDKGHNATPVGNLFGRLLTHAVHMRSRALLNLVGLLDWLFLTLAFWFVGRSCGFWPVVFGLLYLGGCWELTSPFIRGSFLRWDWLALLIAGLAALRTGRHRLAGGLLGAATMIRIFPVLFLFGPLVVLARDVLRHDSRPGLRTGPTNPWHPRRLPPAGRRLFGTFLCVCLGLGAMSLVADQGVAGWRDWGAKMATHNDYVAGYRAGLQQVLVFGFGTSAQNPEERRQARDRMWPVRIILGVSILVLLGYGLWRRDHLAAALSFPALFVLVTPTFYYYSLLAAVVVVCAKEPRRLYATEVIVALLTMQGILQAANAAGQHTAGLSLTLSWLLFLVSVVIAGLVAFGHRLYGGLDAKETQA